MKKNLILTISDYYNFYHLSRFFISLFKTSFDGHVVVFAGPHTGKNTIKTMKKMGVEVISYKEKFPYISTPHADNLKQLPTPIHLYNFRHYLYYDYLLKHEGEFEKTLLTDIRDVVFQRDPFYFQMQDALYVAIENRTKRLGDCQYNSNWIRNGYGEEVLDEMDNHIVSCAGTTLGPTSKVKLYLEKLLEQIIQLRDAYKCADQGAHNYLIHKGAIFPVVKMYNDSTPVMTVGSETIFAFDKDGFMLDGDKQRPGTIHQYDRHPALIKLLNKLIYDNSLQPYFLKLRYKLFK
jgi:hypothetical protein